MANCDPLALPAPSPATRVDGWSPARQRVFLEALAETGVIRAACAACGLSARSAYNLRFRANGTAFRLGWDAAVLIARARLADELMMRAIDGQEDVLVQGEDGMVTRRRHDNRLAMSMLSRLDRMAGCSGSDPAARSANDGDMALARVVAQDFEAFLDMISRVGNHESAAGLTASAALFLAARHSGAALNLVARERCELGEELPEPPPPPPPADPTPEQAVEALRGVWWCDEHDELRTDFPPPPDFNGNEEEEFGDPDYNRSLSDQEFAAQRKIDEALLAPVRAATAAVRDAHFGFAPRRQRKKRRRTEQASSLPGIAFPAVLPVPEPEFTLLRDDQTATHETAHVQTAEPAEPLPDEAGSPWRTVRPWPKPPVQPGRPPSYAEPFY